MTATVSAQLSALVAAKRLEYDDGQRTAAARLDALAKQIAHPRSDGIARLVSLMPWRKSRGAHQAPRGVYLWGGVGRGKTLLMDLFAAAVPPMARARSAERSHFYRFMRGVHADLAEHQREINPLDGVAAVIAARASVLCLDEFIVNDIGDAMLLAGLLDGLFRRGVPLVATSNRRPQDLYKDGLQRQRFLPAIALLESHVDILELDGGTDYRLRELARAPTYFDTGLAQTTGVLEERFAALAGADAHRTRLSVAGRELSAVQVANGAAWFDFDALCEGPRSQNDYIELARSYQTIFISNVPRLDASRDDAARRFIMMVDEFYDRGVKLVMSAAAAPAELYHGERLRFEFERTVSRLIEMQTERYLACQHRP